MTRVLFWNIEKFNQDTLADDDSVEYIVQVIETYDIDFFVVVEIDAREKGAASRGTLDESSGGLACVRLHGWLNGGAEQPPWSLVPPLRTDHQHNSPGESVGVFYRSDRFYFTGPKTWPGKYPGDFSTALPDRTIPAGSAHNPNKPENQGAAQVKDFDEPDDSALWKDQRSPYLTTFAGLKNPEQTLSIIAVHGIANTRVATKYLRDTLPNVKAISVVPPNETRILVGDFNLDVLAEKTDPPIQDAYTKLAQPEGQFQLLLHPKQIADRKKWNEYVSYFTTRIKPAADSHYFTIDKRNPSWYPGYLYTMSKTNARCVDNAYLAPASTNATITIINPIVGSPYNPFSAPAEIPTGTARFDRLSKANVPLDQKARDQKPKDPVDEATASDFRSAANYGRFIETSDHLPLLIEF